MPEQRKLATDLACRARPWAIAVVLGASLGLPAGCATRGAVDDPALIAKLGFIRPGGANRAEVEARLGAPVQSFEGGRLVMYLVGERDDGRLSTIAGLPHGFAYTLFIEYAPDETIARRALLRRAD